MDKKVLLTFAVAVLLVGCRRKTYIEYTPDKSIVVFYDNDVHCNIDGYPAFAGIRDAVASTDTSYVLTVSSGDFVQGGTAGVLSKGEYPVCVMNTVGYDAVTIGNHEFDYKSQRLVELTNMLNCPVTCVNFTRPNEPEPVFKPYVIKKCGKKSVAFIGVLTPSTLTIEHNAFFDEDGRQLYDLHTSDVYQLIQKYVDKARQEGADYVVLLSHIGSSEDEFTVTKLISATNGIDVVLDGHSHSVIEHEYALNKDEKQVLFTQTGTQFAYVGKLLISKDSQISTTLIPFADITQRSAKVQATLDSVKVFYNEVANRKIGYSEVPLTINGADGKRAIRKAETNLGDFVADSYRYVGESEIGIVNGGGVRTDLKVGNVTYQNLIDISPFCNTVDVISCKGNAIIEMLNDSYKLLPEENGAFMQISGLKCTINLSPQGNYVSDVLILDGKTGEYTNIMPEKEYTLCATGYMLELYADILGDYTTIKKEIMTDNEATYEYLKTGLHGTISQVYSNPQGRIVIK